MIVTIPASENHCGVYLVTLQISDNCPICNQKRGDLYGTLSYDGSLRLHCDGWKNPCGHVDKYSAIRTEGNVVEYKEPEPIK